MKKTITLKIEYLDCAKLKKTEETERREVLFKNAIKSFHNQMGDLDKSFKILREDCDRDEVIIEFSEALWEQLKEGFLRADIVAMIDSFVYEEKTANKK